jgi:hypothetical protein
MALILDAHGSVSGHAIQRGDELVLPKTSGHKWWDRRPRSHDTNARLELVQARGDVLDAVSAEHSTGGQQLNELEAGRLESRRAGETRDVLVIVFPEQENYLARGRIETRAPTAEGATGGDRPLASPSLATCNGARNRRPPAPKVPRHEGR